ncbi:hypothetical protein ABVK25_006735 [Lepraria finkii]|uniref:Ribosome assembly factor mrt4 n=1 Tax=Lepraria finkii TaxID=1340010 RepID=A0ABR4B5G4_9LECA
MPKSKRAKVVHLSKTQKKGKELTLRLYANIQECIPKYPYIYVFSVHNMRNTYLKDVRTQLSDSRLFFGKTKAMSHALGHTSSTAPYAGTHLLTPPPPRLRRPPLQWAGPPVHPILLHRLRTLRLRPRRHHRFPHSHPTIRHLVLKRWGNTGGRGRAASA